MYKHRIDASHKLDPIGHLFWMKDACPEAI
jgi:hypothetical protein